MEVNLEKILKRLYSLEYRGINPGLERIEVLCKLLGNPEKRFKSLIIGGTNGKGSTLAFLSSILKEAGYKVGSYTSPHLEKFNERISVNGKLINDIDIAEIASEILKKINEYNANGENTKKFEPTFFEITTALAFEYFKNSGVDIALLEVGLGGRFDAVNIVGPVLSVITNVSKDHTAFLGDSLEKISMEKAGIVKQGTPFVTGVEDPKIREYFISISKERDAKIFLYKEHFHYERNDFSFAFLSNDKTINNLSINFEGEHQFGNASLAIASAIRLVNDIGFVISDENIRSGLKNAAIVGRLEYLSCRMPFPVLLDVAHNESGAKALSKYLKSKFKKEDLVILLGIMKDKDYNGMIEHYSKLADKIILTKASHQRSWDAITMERIKVSNPFLFEVIPDLEFALRYALHNLAKNQTLCITGSIFTVGEARNILWKTFS